MTELILINPPIISESYKWEIKLGSRLPPIGLTYLASYLRQQNIGVEILDAYNLNLRPDEIISYIKDKAPSYVGFTATSSIVTYAAGMASEIKKTFPDITTIIGGSHMSAMPEETISRFTSFDVGVFGEGEKTLFEIIDRGNITDDIRGIVFRKNDTVVKTQAREYITALDELPFPAYDLLPQFPDFYRPTVNNYQHLPVVPIISSRGCPYSCTFCDQSVFGHKLRAYSNDYLIEFIKALKKKYKTKEVCFYDDIFLLNKKKLYDFITKAEEAKLDISWSCEGRIDQLDHNVLSDMKKAGCWQISFGVENGSQKILDYFNKKITVSQIRETIHAVAKAGIKPRAYIIIGSPPETLETLKETERLVLDLPFSDIHISFFTPIPGSKAYMDIVREGWKSDLNKMDVYTINYMPPKISEEILTNHMNKLYRKFYFHPKRLLRYFLMLFNPAKTRHLFGSALAFCRLIMNKSSDAQ